MVVVPVLCGPTWRNMVPDVVSVDGSHSVTFAAVRIVSSGRGILVVSFSLGVCMSESFFWKAGPSVAATASVWFLMIARSRSWWSLFPVTWFFGEDDVAEDEKESSGIVIMSLFALWVLRHDNTAVTRITMILLGEEWFTVIMVNVKLSWTMDLSSWNELFAHGAGRLTVNREHCANKPLERQFSKWCIVKERINIHSKRNWGLSKYYIDRNEVFRTFVVIANNCKQLHNK